MTFSFQSRLARPLGRAIGLLAGFLIERIHAYASHVMLEAYNAFRAPGNRFFELSEPRFTSALISIAILTLPVVLSRTNVVLGINLAFLLFALIIAARLPFTAQTSPYECASSGGAYSDRVSGIPEFELLLIFLLFLSYVLLFLDWGVWVVISLKRVFRRPAPAALPDNDR